jgi:hypothetical protein
METTQYQEISNDSDAHIGTFYNHKRTLFRVVVFLLILGAVMILLPVLPKKLSSNKSLTVIQDLQNELPNELEIISKYCKTSCTNACSVYDVIL